MNLPTQDRIQPLCFGYSHGLNQPSRDVKVVVGGPALSRFEAMDDWLQSAFGIEPGGTPVLNQMPRSAHEDALVAHVWRLMKLRAALLQAVRIPVFELGMIKSWHRKSASPGSWHIVLTLCHVDHVQSTVYTRALTVAARALAWLAGRQRTPAMLEELFSYVDQEFVQQVNATMLGGESTIARLRQAWKRGIEFRHLGMGTYQLGMGAAQLKVDRGAVQFDSALGARAAQNKLRSASLLRDAGLPSPVHIVANSKESALDAAHRLGWPVVVKPIDRDRGEGVTVHITSNEQLRVAFEEAAAFSKSVLIERQVTGVCHRILVAGGRVCFAAKRVPKSVKGDGRQTVSELVDQANAEQKAMPPWSRLKPFPMDEMAMACLAHAGLSTNSIPAEGVLVPLRPIQSSRWGGVVEDLSEEIHPENAELARKAARLFNLTIAGIDIITPDIAHPWHVNGAIINEVNFSPLMGGSLSEPAVASLLAEWLPNGGRIPVDAVISNGLGMAEGLRIQTEYAARGLQCWVTSDQAVVAPSGESVVLSASGLFGKSRALLMDPAVEALVMIIETDELLSTGLPTSHIDRLLDVSDTDSIASPPSVPPVQQKGQHGWRTEMHALLSRHTTQPSVGSIHRTDSM